MFKLPENLPNWFSKKVVVKETADRGLGVFAIENIKKHEIFERAAVLIFSPEVFRVIRDSDHFQGRDHTLMHYTFNWEGGQCAVVWGNGSLYNHGNGDASNSSYRMQTKIPCVEFYAKKVIEPGEEILIHYLRGRCDIDFCDDGTWMESGHTLVTAPRAGSALTSLDGDWTDQG
jgi:hypothetical protein